MQRIKFNSQWKTSLKFWNQITWSSHTESTRSNKQNMSCINNPKFCIHVTSFNNRQNITLNTFATYILSVTFTVNCNFINFVNTTFCFVSNFIMINHAVQYFCCQNFSSFFYCYRAFLFTSTTIHHI